MRPLVGKDIVFDQSIVRPFGQSLVWDVIPGEYFFTRETEPQVKVTVDDMPALCTGMACSYRYAEGSSLITSFSIGGSSSTELTIFGSNFATPQKIEMGLLECSNIVVAASADQITCDLADELPAGNWYPIVTEALGKVRIDETVAAESVPLGNIVVQPSYDLNPFGGELLKITGNNFPASLEARYNLRIMLGSSMICIPYAISKTQIQCETELVTFDRRRMLST